MPGPPYTFYDLVLVAARDTQARPSPHDVRGGHARGRDRLVVAIVPREPEAYDWRGDGVVHVEAGGRVVADVGECVVGVGPTGRGCSAPRLAVEVCPAVTGSTWSKTAGTYLTNFFLPR
jgi:hypothetical protein